MYVGIKLLALVSLTRLIKSFYGYLVWRYQQTPLFARLRSCPTLNFLLLMNLDFWGAYFQLWALCLAYSTSLTEHLRTVWVDLFYVEFISICPHYIVTHFIPSTILPCCPDAHTLFLLVGFLRLILVSKPTVWYTTFLRICINSERSTLNKLTMWIHARASWCLSVQDFVID